MRNGGNDNTVKNKYGTQFRDHAIQKLAKQSNRKAHIAEAQPVNVYLNDRYYGVYNLRERIDEYYIEIRMDTKEKVDVLERCFHTPDKKKAIYGSCEIYDSEVEYAINNFQINSESVYDSITKMFDLENFMDYWITKFTWVILIGYVIT